MSTADQPEAEPGLTVWVVVSGNYEPAEAPSLWTTQESAEQLAAELGGDWHVELWAVNQ